METVPRRLGQGDADLGGDGAFGVIAVGDRETRVEFEHRDLERFGDSEAANRTRVSMDGGWGTILESFQTVVNG